MTCKQILALATLPFFMLACQKDPGEGGKSSIGGKVYVVEYSNNTGQLTGDEYYVAEQRVYIRYGDEQFHSDDVRTGPDGFFQFDWLRKGDYTIFVYSECPACPNELTTVEVNVDLGRNEEVSLNDIIIENWVN